MSTPQNLNRPSQTAGFRQGMPRQDGSFYSRSRSALPLNVAPWTSALSTDSVHGLQDVVRKWMSGDDTHDKAQQLADDHMAVEKSDPMTQALAESQRQKQASLLKVDFLNHVLPSLSIEEDFDLTVNGFLKQAVDHQPGKLYSQTADEAVITTFEEGIDPARHQHRIAQMRRMLWLAIQDHDQILDNRFDELDPTDLIEHFRQRTTLTPNRPGAGPGLVINSLIAAAQSTSRIIRLINWLGEAGSGTETESFNQRFPEPCQLVWKQLNNRYHTLLQFNVAELADLLDTIIQQSKDPGQLAVMIVYDVPGLMSRFGPSAHWPRLLNRAQRQLMVLQEQSLALNRIRAMNLGLLPLDSKLIRHHLGTFLQDRGLNIFENIDEIVRILNRLGGPANIDPWVRGQISRALADFAPENSIAFWGAVGILAKWQSMVGLQGVLSLVDTAVKPLLVRVLPVFLQYQDQETYLGGWLERNQKVMTDLLEKGHAESGQLFAGISKSIDLKNEKKALVDPSNSRSVEHVEKLERQ
ncbi:MAG: hypothetical protein HQL54_04420 [Magnetococcales bacterium]|nr:hypothetical protein [Magnetococcales bacterium]